MDQPAAPTPTPTPAPAPQPPAAPTQIGIGDFQKIEFRAGVIVKAEAHPNADRLLILQVDIGDGQTRQVVAGIRGAYEPDTVVGKPVVVVANLKPATLRGVESQGMVLAANDGAAFSLITLDRPVQPGTQVK